jgi:hypothetical protein
MIDRSISGRMLAGCAHVLGRVFALGLFDPRLQPYGHTVTAAYRKAATCA